MQLHNIHFHAKGFAMSRNWESRDRKMRKRKHGMRVDGGSTKKVQLDLHWKRVMKEKERLEALNEDCTAE